MGEHSTITALPSDRPVTQSQVTLVVLAVSLLAGFIFWMAKIDVTLTSVQTDVADIKAAVTRHVESPGHRESVLRLKALEKHHE